MTDDQKIKQFVNDVYLAKFNRFVDTLLDATPDADALAEIQKVVRWVAMFCDELEMERDSDGRIINWNFLRYNDIDLGTIATVGQQFTLAATYRKLVVNANRPLTITQDGTAVARFKVVDPDQQTKRDDTWTGDRVTQLRNQILFSRLFKTTEVGGHVIADVLKPITRPTYTNPTTLNVAFLTEVPYYELLVLGVAKNATLPGIVEGGLAPTMNQKYNDLLDGAKADSANTSIADDAWDEADFGYIAGIN